MKRILSTSILLLFAAGCVVQSIFPWLSEESRVAEPLLLGAWQDAIKQQVAFFAESTNAASDYAYSVLLVQKKNETSRFTANLHRIDDALLLVVGPEERQDLSASATLPGHLLFKAVLDGDSLKLYGIDLESFGERTAKSKIPCLCRGSPIDGHVLTGTTEESETFVRAQLSDPTFFNEKPLFSFQKLPAAAP